MKRESSSHPVYAPFSTHSATCFLNTVYQSLLFSLTQLGSRKSTVVFAAPASHFCRHTPSSSSQSHPPLIHHALICSKTTTVISRYTRGGRHESSCIEHRPLFIVSRSKQSRQLRQRVSRRVAARGSRHTRQDPHPAYTSNRRSPEKLVFQQNAGG